MHGVIRGAWYGMTADQRLEAYRQAEAIGLSGKAFNERYANGRCTPQSWLYERGLRFTKKDENRRGQAGPMPENQPLVREIARLAGAGLSGGNIATELRITRGKVIGICHRHGISLASQSPHNTSLPGKMRQRRRVRAGTKNPPAKTGRKRCCRDLSAELNAEPANGGKGVSLIDRRMQGSRRECAWVLTDRGPNGEPMCCGASAGHDRYLSFCEAHERIAVSGGGKHA